MTSFNLLLYVCTLIIFDGFFLPKIVPSLQYLTFPYDSCEPLLDPFPSESCGRQTGQQRLDSTTGVFVPAPYERILEIVKKILVLPHQDGHQKNPVGGWEVNEMVCVFVAICFQQKKSEKMGRLVVSGVLEEPF